MIIKANGTYDITTSRSAASTVLYTDSLNGASVLLMAYGVPLLDGVLADNSQYVIHHGVGADVVADVTGFTSQFNLTFRKG